MEHQTDGMSREEIRKKRRQKEKLQALLILAAILLVVALVVGGVVMVLMKTFAGKEEKPEDTKVDAVTSVVAEETDAEVQPEEILPEETQQEEIQPEEIQPEETQQEEEEPSMADSVIDEILGKEDMAAIEARVDEKLASMTLEEKVAELFFVTPAQLMGLQSDVTAVGSDFGSQVSAYPVGGLLLDESNMTTEEEFITFLSNVQSYASSDTLIGIENEGGEDAPFIASGFSENVIASHQEIGESLGVSGAYSAGISIGSELRRYGIDVNFTPNVDVSLTQDSVAEKEGFGVDAQETAELGKNLVKGLADQNIVAAVGHFPSYGDVKQDGDGGPVISNRTKEDLKGEYAPYLAAIEAGADMVVVSHVSLPKVRGDNRPASLSKEVITDIIRTEWEYDGVVITDFMNRSCMYQKYTYAEAAVGAIEAGADMILSPKNFKKSYDGIIAAINDGTLTEERIDESVRRIYRVKYSHEE